jgi:hypothetical protein
VLIYLAVACAWIAMSAVVAACLALLGRAGAAGKASRAEADERSVLSHEDFYPLEPLPATVDIWR